MKLAYVLGLVASLSSSFAAPLPSDAESTLAPRAERFPPSNYSGRLRINDNNGNFLGFVNKNTRDDGSYSGETTRSYSEALLVLFQGDTNGNVENTTDIEIEIYQPRREQDQYKWLASIVGGQQGTFILTSSATETPVGSKAVNGDTLFNVKSKANKGLETHVWSYFPQTFELKPFWIDAKGNKGQMELAVVQGQIIMTADAQSFIKAHGGDEVQLFLN